MKLPRHVIPKKLSKGATAYYYNVPSRYRALGCTVSNEPLGQDYNEACKQAATLNGLFDEWDDARRGLPVTGISAPKVGTVDWLFREYKQSGMYTEKVAKRSRKDYEWAMREVCEALTNSGKRVGNASIKSIDPRAADKLYSKFIKGKSGERLRTGEKLVNLCRKAWRVVHRLYPDEFPKDVPNPWKDVATKRRVKGTKGAVTREQVYEFANGCMTLDDPDAKAAGAAAVICFEWLQRPENVIGGHIKWAGYRTGPKPTIRVEHHKTGAIVDHPLEDSDGVLFYADAEAVLSKLPKIGVPMIVRKIDEKTSKPYAMSTMQHIVQRTRKALKMDSSFTLDACRHGGMTELEEAELTDGQGRALSAHRTRESYAGYAKRTEARMLSATRKRHAHRLANEQQTSVQNDGSECVQNEIPTNARKA